METLAPRKRSVPIAIILLALLIAALPSAGRAEDRARIPLIRVGIASSVEEVRLTADGAWALGLLGGTSRPTRISKGEVWTLRADGADLVVRDGGNHVRGTVRDTLYAFPDDPESGPLRVGRSAYRGELLLWASAGRVTGVNMVDLESYVRAVLPLEMGAQPAERFEALKAQAVAARSYSLAMLGARKDRGFDVFATVDDQVYGGVGSEKPVCDEAVEDTRGIVAEDQGAPIRAYYCSTCGGHTAAPEEVWNRPTTSYLRAVRDQTGRVDDSFCKDSPWYHWSEEWTGAEFEQMLRSSLPRVVPKWNPARAGALKNVIVRSRSASNRVSCLRLEFRKGHVDLAGDQIRWVLRRPKGGEGLRSVVLNRVECAISKGKVKKVRIAGQGYGHGVGMCQFGAMGMAQAGYRFDQILRFYYRGAEIRRFY